MKCQAGVSETRAARSEPARKRRRGPGERAGGYAHGAATNGAATPGSGRPSDSVSPAAGASSSPTMTEAQARAKGGPILAMMVRLRDRPDGMKADELAPFILETAALLVGPTEDLFQPEVKACGVLIAHLVMDASTIHDLAALVRGTQAQVRRFLDAWRRDGVWAGRRHGCLTTRWRDFIVGMDDEISTVVFVGLTLVATGAARVEWVGAEPAWRAWP